MVSLQVDGGYSAWREQALRALAAGWSPEQLCWCEKRREAGAASQQMGLDYELSPPVSSISLREPQGCEPNAEFAVRISKGLSALLQDAALCRTPKRWALLYRVLWRWHHGERSVASVADEDGA